MLFLRREGKWDEVAYADMFFTLRNHPEWQKECGMGAPQDPLVLALEKEQRTANNRKMKRCCSACSIGQQCTKLTKTRTHDELLDYYQAPAERGLGAERREDLEEGEDSSLPRTPPASPVASRTRKQQGVFLAPLREAVGPDGTQILIKVPFSSFYLENWKKIVKDYRSDPGGVTRHFQYMIRQHNPDWNDIQLLLDSMTETEKDLILRTAQNLAEDSLRGEHEDIKDHFPRQDPHWDLDRTAERDRLIAYREWIVKGMERAIPRTINWSALYAIRQGPRETPSEFLDRLRDTMRRHTSLDPGSEIGIQQLVSLFIGQSVGDIRRKLQKMKGLDARNLENLLEEAWRVFSNREEEGRRQDKRILVAALEEIGKAGMDK
uniref:Core shell protein Gag P30 domain-containing protein n=1 Tax=Phasianus colchicus TaxID=9054 RepID=A0A669QRN4_PHACC